MFLHGGSAKSHDSSVHGHAARRRGPRHLRSDDPILLVNNRCDVKIPVCIHATNDAAFSSFDRRSRGAGTRSSGQFP
jgi:hypothetical protein